MTESEKKPISVVRSSFICAEAQAGKGKVFTCHICKKDAENIVAITIEGRGFNVCQEDCFVEVTQKVLNRFQALRREGVIGPGELVKE